NQRKRKVRHAVLSVWIYQGLFCSLNSHNTFIQMKHLNHHPTIKPINGRLYFRSQGGIHPTLAKAKAEQRRYAKTHYSQLFCITSPRQPDGNIYKRYFILVSPKSIKITSKSIQQ